MSLKFTGGCRQIGVTIVIYTKGSRGEVYAEMRVYSQGN